MKNPERLLLLGLLILPACATTDFQTGNPGRYPGGNATVGDLIGAQVTGPDGGVVGALGSALSGQSIANPDPGATYPTAATAYTDAEVRQLLARSLGSGFSGYHWLPDNPDRGRAAEAIGIVYIPLQGAAGNHTIEVGLFRRTAGGFQFAGKVQDLFGHQPRDARFLPDRIELTSTMPRPGDARCCPTGTARWSIDRHSLVATRLR